ncbi:ABC transporter permease subunit [Actinoplanes sp. NPDC051861]|uniref:ABC transporter permease subunit n=1 Tax=Actinoplanes sp. NPDC051861 TaxID=3155170 RepID=UPI00344512B5
MTAFYRAVVAEWTKLRTVRSTGLALLAMIGLTMLLSLLAATLSTSTANDARLSVDQFHFVHRPVTGDATVTARVSQSDTGEWAKAGLMVKEGTASGSSYAAIMLTPGHGVRLQADARTEVSRPSAAGPRWLRLRWTGQSVTGYESPDGVTWNTVGTVAVAGRLSEAGLFVASPPRLHLLGEIPRYEAVPGSATFQDVAPDGPGWRDTPVVEPPSGAAVGEGVPSAPPLAGGSRWSGTAMVTVTGSGDIGGAGMGGINLTDLDRVRAGLSGVQFGLIGAIALGALAVTAEFRTGTIRTTFAARPGRGTVLAAKSLVVAVVVFVSGLALAVAAFLITRPLQHANGYHAPIYPSPALTSPPVLRAVAGAALFLSLIAVFSLAVGTIVRRTAGAVVILLTGLVIVPVVAAGTSGSAAEVVGRFTPLAGLSILQTVELTPLSNAVVTGVWAGFAVLCGYTAAALGAAFWILNRRDA